MKQRLTPDDKKRLTARATVATTDAYTFDATLDAIEEQIAYWREKAVTMAGGRDIKVIAIDVCSPAWSDQPPEFEVFVTYLENDTEYDARIGKLKAECAKNRATAKAAKADKKQRELEQQRAIVAQMSPAELREIADNKEANNTTT